MLFSSYPFIFLFLPIVLFGYFALGRLSDLAPVIWLALASLVFYAVSNWQFVPLLLASVAFNYIVGLLLISGRPGAVLQSAVLTIGVAGDLLVLGIFKYAAFLAANFNPVFAAGFPAEILPPAALSSHPFTHTPFLPYPFPSPPLH